VATSERERILGGVYGLLVGDAVGVPYEFKAAHELPLLDEIDMPPTEGFERVHESAPAGAWSDDGAQALCLLESLLEREKMDPSDFGARLVRWRYEGHLAVDRVVFDVGLQTADALAALRRGVPVEKAARRDEHSNGNGSLMRVLPLALWHRGSDEELVRDAALQSLPTHPHPRSQVCCALYCLWARATFRGYPDAWSVATRALRDHCVTNDVWKVELEQQIQPDAPIEGRGSGYVVDCLRSAVIANREHTYERVIQRAVSFGNDTDTTAAVAGGIAGIRFGVAGVPERWLAALAGKHIVEPLVNRLLSRIAS
jgi:ADP-ribosyl-[dinitrogen reductase] hydrolase